MAIERVPVDPVQLTTAGVDIYSVASGKKFLITALTILNVGGNAETFSLYRVPSGGTVGDSNKIVEDKNLADGEDFTVYQLVGQIIEGGGKLHGTASANSAMTVHLSGTLITE